MARVQCHTHAVSLESGSNIIVLVRYCGTLPHWRQIDFTFLWGSEEVQRGKVEGRSKKADRLCRSPPQILPTLRTPVVAVREGKYSEYVKTINSCYEPREQQTSAAFQGTPKTNTFAVRLH